MAKQVLFYEEAVPVSWQRHGNLSVKAGADYGFARKVNAVPVTTVEFPRAAAEYAIVFAGSEETVVPVVVLGIQDQNTFVDEEGRWKARYVPAFVRRYPFVFAANDDGSRFTLCIDETFAGCNHDGRGERLFDADGERTQYLKSVLQFQQEYQAHFNATVAFCRRLQELSLLAPVQAQFAAAGGRRHALAGFSVVNRERLKALSEDKLAQMVRSDELELVYLHLHSMGNLTAMTGNLQKQIESADAETNQETAARDTLN
jgi:hypothetical protein